MLTKTQENLLKAFVGESQARNRYTIFAKLARKEDMEWIARVFEETADQERAHAEELYEMITEPINIDDVMAIKPFGKIIDNLRYAAEGERHEWTELYPSFEEQAKVDGDKEAERLFREVKGVEEKHEERYIILAKHINDNTLYNQNTELEWKCLNCGYIHKGKTPPETCPVCKKPPTWYMALGLIR